VSLTKDGNAGVVRFSLSWSLAQWAEKPKPEPSFYGQEGSGLGAAGNPATGIVR